MDTARDKMESLSVSSSSGKNEKLVPKPKPKKRVKKTLSVIEEENKAEVRVKPLPNVEKVTYGEDLDKDIDPQMWLDATGMGIHCRLCVQEINGPVISCPVSRDVTGKYTVRDAYCRLGCVKRHLLMNHRTSGFQFNLLKLMSIEVYNYTEEIRASPDPGLLWFWCTSKKYSIKSYEEFHKGSGPIPILSGAKVLPLVYTPTLKVEMNDVETDLPPEFEIIDNPAESNSSSDVEPHVVVTSSIKNPTQAVVPAEVACDTDDDSSVRVGETSLLEDQVARASRVVSSQTPEEDEVGQGVRKRMRFESN